MKLLLKFNIIFLVVFGLGSALTAFLAYNFLRSDAKSQVIGQARLMMQTTLAVRRYTSSEIKPLLATRNEERRNFLPQTVPSHSAIDVFGYIHEQYPDYAYKEATLNPTNLRDRAVDWETDIVNHFRNHADEKELVGERMTPTGGSIFLAQPMRIVDPACLECHSTPAKAPPSMIRLYGPNNGFGWNLNEIVGAQIVSVPESLAIKIADDEARTLMISLAVIALATLAVLDLLLYFAVIRPVARLSTMADEISRGNREVDELKITGRDEISTLAESFNRMHRSLVRAMQMLNQDPEA